MPETAPPPSPGVPVADLAGWVHRLVCLRDDVGFDLDRRGITATLNDVIDSMQQVRRRADR